MRSEARNNELALSALAGCVGAVVGLLVIGLRGAVGLLHMFAFGIAIDGHLSDGVHFEGWRVILMPAVGGALVGILAWAFRRWRQRDTVDAIEANALYGGRMSLIDSLNLSLLTVLSVGFGGSIGLEAAYTQLGSGFASKFGQIVKLRRTELRLLVGCGAAAAISAAFNAPLAGAFYAFELIIGSYTLTALAPIAAASLAGALVSRFALGSNPIFSVEHPIELAVHDYILFFLLGLAAAGLSITTMKSVTAIEAWLRRRSIPQIARPAIGGLLVGLIAFAYPQVLGSGHGAILYALHTGFTLPVLVGLLVAKLIASAISVGAGLRGGLFSTSLFMGVLFGGIVAIVLGELFPFLAIDQTAYTLVGMGALAAGIVGGPVTMMLLVLETTSDFSLTLGVMVGVITSTVVVRQFFGYSFATWRFHVRGLRIQSAHDVGWIADLTVGRLMNRGVETASGTLSVGELRARYPLGSVKRVFAVDAQDRLLGVIDPVELHGGNHDEATDTTPVSSLLEGEPVFLVPDANVRTALMRFDQSTFEALPVVDNPEDRHVVGFLSEAFALRRYNQELERRRAEDAGDGGLFSPAV